LWQAQNGKITPSGRDDRYIKTGDVILQDFRMLRFFSILCLFGLLIAPPRVNAAETFDRILAIVNDEIITQSEFNRYLTLVMFGAEQEQAPDLETQRQLLGQFVEKKLLMQEAKQLKITLSEQDLDQAMQAMIVRNNISFNDFKSKLESAGLMVEDVRSAMRGELITSELIGREVHAKVSISDAEMERYYLQNIAPDEQEGARVRLSQILLLVKEDFTDEQISALKDRAESLRAQLEAGASFGEMAAMYSQWPSDPGNGDLGFFYKNQLLPEVEQVAFSIPVNAVSPVIKTPVGFHIIKVTFRDTGEAPLSWKTHREDIRRALYGQAFQEVYEKWYSDLQARSHIEILF
jgi:peptidyl-prolyl cis-trans isomerase SurA